MKKIDYIDNDITKGIIIDWNFLYKELLKLIKTTVKKEEVFNGIYIPKPPLKSAEWFIDMSERSVGKTTQYLLLGLLANKYYGIKIEYIRLKKDGIAPKNAIELWKTVLEFNYIEKIFGDYNNLKYKSKGWYLSKVDENRNETTSSEIEVCHMHSLDNVDSLKSVYNSPKGDIIILDEFIPTNGITTEEQFLSLMQLHSTIRRMRLSTRTFLLANTISQYTHFFNEFEISKDIQTLRLGEEKIITTPKGVRIWVHLIKFNEIITEKRKVNNLRFYGFSNPKLSSIIGGSEWETKNYPHLPKKQLDEMRKLYIDKIFIKHYDDYLALEIWYSSKIGMYLYIRKQTKPITEDTYIYTLETSINKNEHYGLGMGNELDKLIWLLYKRKKTFFSHNESGSLFENYLQEIEK